MPREGKGNLRLVFPGITGNGNSRSPLIPARGERERLFGSREREGKFKIAFITITNNTWWTISWNFSGHLSPLLRLLGMMIGWFLLRKFDFLNIYMISKCSILFPDFRTVPTRLYCRKSIFGYFPIENPIKIRKKLQTAEGMVVEQKKTVLKSGNKMEHFETM